MTTAPPLVHLASARDNVEASVLRSYLADHGIHCHVQGENHRSLLGTFGGYIDINLMVSGEDLDQARQLLQEYQAAASEPALDAAEEDEQGDDEAAAGHDPLDPSIRRLRGARMFGLVFPLAIVHLLVGAHVRGLIMVTACAGAWYMTMSGSRTWAFLIPAVIIFDMIEAGHYVRSKLRKRGTPSAGSIPQRTR